MFGLRGRVAVVVVLACWLTVLSGSALAAPPSEPPGQAKKAEDPAAAAAPSEPPGQAKKADDPAGPSTGTATAPGQAKKAERSHGVNATSEGVKPSSTTDKNTTTSAGARPDVSKRYGNGTTAAQIATSRGAPADTEIRGPGNSQPHKVCRNGHWVDVHAVKSYTTGGTCGSEPGEPSSTATTSFSAAAAPGSTAAPVETSSGVLGAEYTGSPPSDTARAHGVAGAFATVGGVAGGSLPFTGLPLWGAILAGIGAIAIGLLLVRQSRPAAL
jgi:hypothetical protein